MKVKEYVKKNKLTNLYLIEDDYVDILSSKDIYDAYKEREITRFRTYGDCEIAISCLKTYDKITNMSYVLMYKNKDGIVAVGDKAVARVLNYEPYKYEVLNLDAVKVMNNKKFVIGILGTGVIDYKHECRYISELVKKLTKKCKSVKSFIKCFNSIYKKACLPKCVESVEYRFFIADKNLMYDVRFKDLKCTIYTKEEGLLCNVPSCYQDVAVFEFDPLYIISRKFQYAIAHTHENQKRELDDTFSVSKESDVVILKFKGEKDDKTN